MTRTEAAQELLQYYRTYQENGETPPGDIIDVALDFIGYLLEERGDE